MAFDPNQKDPNAEAMAQPGQQVQPPTTSGPGAGPGPAGKGSAPQAAPQQPFQNLQAYLTANAPQVEAQANTIAGNLTNQYGQVQGDINKGQSDFNSQVQGGYAAPNAALTNQAATNPTAVAASPTDLAGFQALYNDTYTGPSNYESSTPYANLSQEVGSAANNATNFNSVPGMQTYFQGQNPNATAGGNTLDATLLATDPNAISTVQAAAKPFGTLNDYLNGTVTSADQGVTAAQKAASDEAAAVQNKFNGTGGVIPTFEQGVTDRLNQASTAAQTAATTAKTDLLAGKPTDADLKVLGIQPGQMNEIESALKSLQSDYGQNFDLGNYATMQSPGAVFGSPNAIANAGDYATEAALSQLTGKDLSSFLDPSQAGNAGKQNNSLLNFNATGAQGDASKALNQQDTAKIDQAMQIFNGANIPGGTVLSNPLVYNKLMNYFVANKDQTGIDALQRYQISIGGPQGPQAPIGEPIGFQPVPSTQPTVGFRSPAPGIY